MEIFGITTIPVWTLLLCVLLLMFVRYMRRLYDVFPSIGVQGPRPLPIMGNLLEIMRKGFVESTSAWTEKYGRVYGMHEGCHQMLIVGDIDMLRDITVKEFNNFPNRRNFNAEKISNPPLTEFLTLLRDDDWRHNRNTLTPTFSSGKLKRMTSCITDAAITLARNLKSEADSGEPIDIKRFTGTYTMDVIAATAFGIQLDTQSTPNDPFIKHARKFFDISLINPVFIMIFFFPSLLPVAKILGMDIFPKESMDFFSNTVRLALKERRENPTKYKDFLQLMIQAEKQAHSSHDEGDDVSNEMVNVSVEADGTHWIDKRKGKGLTDSEILAASILFFTAGYETTATTLSHALYHLAVNPGIMERLIEEIDEHFPEDQNPDYESIGNLSYLDMVVKEALRISPPIGRMDRECKRDTTIGGIKIPAGMGVALPIYSIHHDPGYWPDPEVFDPERFTPENRESHHPLQWIPFGYGPRNCIGMRLAIVEMKICLVKLLQKYKFVPNSKTKPLKFGEQPLLTVKDGVWLTVKHRV